MDTTAVSQIINAQAQTIDFLLKALSIVMVLTVALLLLALNNTRSMVKDVRLSIKDLKDEIKKELETQLSTFNERLLSIEDWARGHNNKTSPKE
jgi:Sec-independent protein translocase protein TatA